MQKKEKKNLIFFELLKQINKKHVSHMVHDTHKLYKYLL